MSEPVIVAIPPKGSSLQAVLDRLISVGWVHGGLVDGIRDLVRADKERIKLEEQLIRLWDECRGDGAEVLARLRAAGQDPDPARVALARMRRYRDDAGRELLTFTPKATVDAMLARLREDPDGDRRAAAYTMHLELDLTRYGRPSRMMFDHLEFEWTDPRGVLVHGVLIGTDHEVTPTYLRRHKRDLSLTCYDAFHSTLMDALDTGKVRNWQELMDHLIEANTDVRILGSLGLNDYLGHFVLMPEPHARQVRALRAERTWNANGHDPKLAVLAASPVLIDGNYEYLYIKLLDSAQHGIRFEHTSRDIEQACLRETRNAVYIVQSGGTIRRTPGLYVVGAELLTSETIVAVNQERLDHNDGVGELVESLAPSGLDGSAKWRQDLAARLGEQLI